MCRKWINLEAAEESDEVVNEDAVFCDVTPRSLIDLNQHFGSVSCLHLQDMVLCRVISENIVLFIVTP
jgi:hypothetical protein